MSAQPPDPNSLDAVVSFLHSKAGLDSNASGTQAIARNAQRWGASTDEGGILTTAALIDKDETNAVAKLCGEEEVGEIVALRAANAYRAAARELQADQFPASVGSGKLAGRWGKRGRRESSSSSLSSGEVARARQATKPDLLKLVQRSVPDHKLETWVNEAAQQNLCWSQKDAAKHGHAGGMQEGRGERGSLTPKGEELMDKVKADLVSTSAWEDGLVKDQYPTLRGLEGTVHDNEGEWTPELALDQLKEWFHAKLSRENEKRTKG